MTPMTGIPTMAATAETATPDRRMAMDGTSHSRTGKAWRSRWRFTSCCEGNPEKSRPLPVALPTPIRYRGMEERVGIPAALQLCSATSTCSPSHLDGPRTWPNNNLTYDVMVKECATKAYNREKKGNWRNVRLRKWSNAVRTSKTKG